MKKGSGNPTVLRDVFGGRGELNVWTLLKQSSLPPFETVFACELDPSASVGTVQQTDYPELLIITEGNGVLGLDQESISVAAGRTIEVPVGARIWIRNESADEPLRYIIVKANQK